MENVVASLSEFIPGQPCPMLEIETFYTSLGYELPFQDTYLEFHNFAIYCFKSSNAILFAQSAIHLLIYPN